MELLQKILLKKNIEIRVEKLLNLDDKDFKLHTGMTKQTFYEMLDYLIKVYDDSHKLGSRKGTSVVCRLVLAITYWRDYRPMRQMGLDYDLPKSTVCDCVKWVEISLSKWDKFQLKDIKSEIEKAKQDGINVEVVIGDVEEQPIERPKENQEEYYSGKKKKHTTKNQIIITENGERILNWYNAKGTTHDYRMIKDSQILPVLEDMKIKGKFDSGYQGIQEHLSGAIIPYKKSKHHELTDKEKKHNKELSRTRINVEHTNRELKIFRIMKETYRNHMNRYDTKLSIICGIYNLNHSK